jgi:hypothetical protein
LHVAGFLFFWLSVPTSYAGGGIRFTMQCLDTLSFFVCDPHQRPLAGVLVVSASESGTTQPVATDSAGFARIRPGESEVLAVFIQGRGFRLRHWGVPEHLAPTCEEGLSFQVTLGGDQDRP